MKSQDVRPIVCGTDFSRSAEQAANVAADLAARLGTTLLLVHGVDERGEFPQVYGPRFAEARSHLDKEEARLRRLGADVRGDVTIGVLDGGLARFAERADARLIVVGASGTGMLKRMIGTGSVAERIAETAWVPTLVVQDAAPFSCWFGHERALRIFVGADFSPVSEAVLRCVRELSEVEPCKVTVGFVDLHATERGEQALHLSPNAPPAPEMQQMLTHDLREKTWSILRKHDVHVHVLPAPGRVDQRLLELASEAESDLIVVGTHQWQGLSRLRHHSVSRRILHTAKTNVLCVPGHTVSHGTRARHPKMRRVLVATDLSTHGGYAVPYAWSMVEPGGVVRLMTVVKPPELHERRLAHLQNLIPAAASVRDVRVETKIVEERDVATAICRQADEFGADLVCIGAHGHSALLARALGSVAQEVIARSRRPVLVVRSPSS